MIRKFYSFACICMYVFGVISSLGWTLYNKAWAAAFGVICVAAMAYPFAKERLNELMK